MRFGGSTEGVVGNLTRFKDAAKQAMERSRSHIKLGPDDKKATTERFASTEPPWRILISNKILPRCTKARTFNFDCIRFGREGE
jgi:hypothetical protein